MEGRASVLEGGVLTWVVGVVSGPGLELGPLGLGLKLLEVHLAWQGAWVLALALAFEVTAAVVGVYGYLLPLLPLAVVQLIVV